VHNTKPMYWERSRLIFGVELPSKEKLILLAISDHLGSNDECWPSVTRLAKRTGYGRRSVLYAIDSLSERGAITIIKRTGGVNHYRLCMDWLREQCHDDTRAESAPVQDLHQCRYCTGGCKHCTGVVQDLHGGGAESAPKGDKEGHQGRKSRKDTNKSNRTKALSIKDVQDIMPPKQLTDALPGYRDAFAAWCEVRKGTSWRQKPAQVVSFHGKMLKAHNDGLDVMAALGKAFDAGWQGINASYMQPLTVKRDTVKKPALHKDLKAQYRAYLLGELNK